MCFSSLDVRYWNVAWAPGRINRKMGAMIGDRRMLFVVAVLRSAERRVALSLRRVRRLGPF